MKKEQLRVLDVLGEIAQHGFASGHLLTLGERRGVPRMTVHPYFAFPLIEDSLEKRC
jgi:hypothetical protein